MGEKLSSNPRWSLRGNSLIIGQYDSGETHEKHFLQTIGSGNWYWSEFEEFRFGKTNNLLQSVWFHIPEVNLDSEQAIATWQSQPPVEGLLRLVSPEQLKPEMGDFRFFEHSGRFFACVTEAALKDSKHRLRFRIARDFDLLFADQQFCGWLLSTPIDYLVYFWEAPCPILQAEDNSLAFWVREYLNLVAEPYIDLMEEADPKFREQLEELYNLIDLNYGAVNQRKILHDAIADVIEKFYD
ncbi:hypothetical protein [Scytonema sp. NUACC26]|uniref:hypothetical protein n=1 Tax=Scytonema sp. NUACC26 TaxID=3140176 RepID=UPI0034DC1AD8